MLCCAAEQVWITPGAEMKTYRSRERVGKGPRDTVLRQRLCGQDVDPTDTLLFYPVARKRWHCLVVMWSPQLVEQGSIRWSRNKVPDPVTDFGVGDISTRLADERHICLPSLQDKAG